MNFSIAVETVLELEADFVEDPDDAGGATRFGISQRAYPSLNIRTLTRDEAKEIYLRDYWNALKCDELPYLLRLPAFDGAVNQGVAATIKRLQGLVGEKRDGVLGPKTLSALVREKQWPLLSNFMAERALGYTLHPKFGKFGRGWMRRLMTIQRETVLGLIQNQRYDS